MRTRRVCPQALILSFSTGGQNTWGVFFNPQGVLGLKRLEKMEHKKGKP